MGCFLYKQHENHKSQLEYLLHENERFRGYVVFPQRFGLVNQAIPRAQLVVVHISLLLRHDHNLQRHNGGVWLQMLNPHIYASLAPLSLTVMRLRCKPNLPLLVESQHTTQLRDDDVLQREGTNELLIAHFLSMTPSITLSPPPPDTRDIVREDSTAPAALPTSRRKTQRTEG